MGCCGACGGQDSAQAKEQYEKKDENQKQAVSGSDLPPASPVSHFVPEEKEQK